MKKTLFILSLLLFFFGVQTASATSFTLPDELLLSSEFYKQWGASSVSKTDNDPGVQFTFGWAAQGDKIGLGDKYELSALAGGIGDHNADFSAYSSFEMSFTNLSDYALNVHLFMNTGFTGSNGKLDTYWGGSWVTVNPGETVLALLNFSSAEAWNIADDPVHTGLTNGQWYEVFRLTEVTNIGFEVEDSNKSIPAGTNVALGVNFAPAPVPEPATMLLLGSGLIGLAGIGRKRFFKKS